MKRMSHEAALAATELLRVGMSSPIVAVEIGVPEIYIKRLRATLALGIARRGVLRETSSLLATDRGRTEAALIATLYRSLGGQAVVDAVQRGILVTTYHIYQQLRREAGMPARGALTIDEAWTLARDIRSGIVRWRKCPAPCHALYVLVWNQRAMNTSCPVCSMEKRHGFSGSARMREITGIHANHTGFPETKAEAS